MYYFFLFSGYLNLQLGNVECTRRIWLSRKLNSKGLTLKLLYMTELYLIFWQKAREFSKILWLSIKLNSKGLTFKLSYVVYTWNLNAIQQECASFWRFSSPNKNHRFLWKPLLFFNTKYWFHLASKNRNPETVYRIKCDVGANKNAGQAFSMPRLSSHFILYKVSGFRFFSPLD